MNTFFAITSGGAVGAAVSLALGLPMRVVVIVFGITVLCAAIAGLAAAIAGDRRL